MVGKMKELLGMYTANDYKNKTHKKAFFTTIACFSLLTGCVSGTDDKNLADDKILVDQMPAALDAEVDAPQKDTQSSQDSMDLPDENAVEINNSLEERVISGSRQTIGWNAQNIVLAHTYEQGTLDLTSPEFVEINSKEPLVIQPVDSNVLQIFADGPADSKSAIWWAQVPGRTMLYKVNGRGVSISNGEVLHDFTASVMESSGLFIIMDSSPTALWQVTLSDGKHVYTTDEKKLEAYGKNVLKSVVCYLPETKNQTYWPLSDPQTWILKDMKTNNTFYLNPQSETMILGQADLMLNIEEVDTRGEGGRYKRLEYWMNASDSEPPIYAYHSEKNDDVILIASTELAGGDPVTAYLQGKMSWKIPEAPNGYHLVGVVGHCLYRNEAWLEYAESVFQK